MTAAPRLPLEAPGLAVEVERRRLRSTDAAAEPASLVAGKSFAAVAALSLEVAQFAVWAALVLFVESVSWESAAVVAAGQSTEASSAGGLLR